MKRLILFIVACLLIMAAPSMAVAQDPEPQIQIMMVHDRTESAARLLEADSTEEASGLWGETALAYRTDHLNHMLSELPRHFRQAHLIIMDTQADILFDGHSNRLGESLASLYVSANIRVGCADMGVLIERLVGEIRRSTEPHDEVHLIFMTPGISSPQVICNPPEGTTVLPITLPQPVESWNLAALFDLPQLKSVRMLGLQDQQRLLLAEEVQRLRATRPDRATFDTEIVAVRPTIDWIAAGDARLFVEGINQ